MTDFINIKIKETLSILNDTASLIRQKGKPQNGCFKKTKQAKQIFRKTNISNPLICTRTCEYQGVRNVRFFEKFGVLCFLETPVLRFALLRYCQRLAEVHAFFIQWSFLSRTIVKSHILFHTVSYSKTDLRKQSNYKEQYYFD